MALGTPFAQGYAYSLSGGSSVAPLYAASPAIAAGDGILLLVGQKPSTANGGTVTTPSGFALLGSLTGAGGYGSTLGADTGNTNVFAYTKTAAGGEAGTVVVTVGTNGVCWAILIVIPAGGANSLSWAITTGSDTAAGNVSVTGAAAPGFASGDLALWGMCIPTDVTTPSQFSAHVIAATGATFAGGTELAEADSNTGDDIGGYVAYAAVSAGPSSAAPTVTATAGGTTTNVRGPMAIVRLRPVGGFAQNAGRADEVDTALALGGVQTRALGRADGTAAALGLTAVQIRAVGRADAAASALGLTAVQIRAVGRADAAASALGLAPALPVGMAGETSTPLALGLALGAGRAEMGATGLGLGAVQIRAVSPAGEADAAFALGLGVASGRGDEADGGLGLGAAQLRGLGRADQDDVAIGVGVAIGAGRGDETDAALGLGTSTSLPVGLALETGDALGLAGLLSRSAGLAGDTTFALPLAAVQLRAAGAADGSDQALGLPCGVEGGARHTIDVVFGRQPIDLRQRRWPVDVERAATAIDLTRPSWPIDFSLAA